MRHIEGLVCVAATIGIRNGAFLFGKNTGNGTGIYESFRSNDLTPFKDWPEAKQGHRELVETRAKDIFGRIHVAEIRMDLAMTDDELGELKDRNNLIVVMYNHPNSINLIGRHIDGAVNASSTIPGSLLEYNGFRPIGTYDDAYYIASEAHRQGGCPVKISTFDFKRVRLPKTA
ncbi:hypothetical protein HY389_00380 [Candidatus Daviesbacteria bacterium]|nr:hypothetical protein [Candidatus Daviesbacteria bacterium]